MSFSATNLPANFGQTKTKLAKRIQASYLEIGDGEEFQFRRNITEEELWDTLDVATEQERKKRKVPPEFQVLITEKQTLDERVAKLVRGTPVLDSQPSGRDFFAHLRISQVEDYRLWSSEELQRILDCMRHILCVDTDKCEGDIPQKYHTFQNSLDDLREHSAAFRELMDN